MNINFQLHYKAHTNFFFCLIDLGVKNMYLVPTSQKYFLNNNVHELTWVHLAHTARQCWFYIGLYVLQLLQVVRFHQVYVAQGATTTASEGVTVTSTAWQRVTAVLTIIQPVNNVSENKHRN